MSLFLTRNPDKALKLMLRNLNRELTVIELFSYAVYFNNPEMSGESDALRKLGAEGQSIPLSKADYKLAMQTIQRVHALRELIRARVK